MPSTQDIFRKLVGLVGKSVEVAVRSSGKQLRGTVAHAMFDSFLLDVDGNRQVVSFDDLLYLDEVPQKS